ncbi:MAG TPA: lytic transglycosylase domain-containing protein, partial [Nocardiopsis listeri]|uniref:lytic transglycosylase domain-containing protein n=1 Tax=Nocardiopsis listeri TaxID=53440 RepID=UPI001D804EC5
MSLRSTAAVGAATLVAGATFAVSAFADDGLDPNLAASAAVPGSEEPAADTESEADTGSEENEDFFSSEQLSEEELQNRREQAQEQRESARGNSVVSTSATGSAVQEEEEEEEEEVPPEFEGDPKGIALQMVLDQGWGAEEFNGCLEPLWEKESNWNHTAQNASSGA